MNNIKKLISGLLCIFMLAVMLPEAQAYAADYDITEETKLLEAIGVLDGENEENSVVTRAELIKSVMKLKKFDSKATADSPLFTDLSESHWAYHEIIAASQLGYISADNQGKIHPDSPADGYFAFKVVVDALDYKGIAASYGGDSNAYLKAAGILKLTEGISVSMSAPVERKDYIKLLYNALFVPLSQNYVKGDTLNFNSTSDKTLLNSVFDIYETTGVVSADRYITLGIDPYDAVKKFIVIGGAMYGAGNIDTAGLVGLNVKLYYEIDDNDDKNVICAIPKNNNIVELKNCDITYSNFKISSLTRGSDKEKTYNIGINTSIIWNFKLISEAEFSAKLPYLSGEMKLIDNNYDGKYDVVIAEDQKIVEIFGYDIDSDILTASDGTVYELDRYDNVQFQNFDKTLSSPLILQNARYVSVFAYENDYRNIAIRECKADIQAVLNSVSASDRSVSLNDYGTLYISKKAVLNIAELEPGQEYVFSFDCYGDIINVTTQNAGNNNLVYLIDVNHKTKLNETLSVLVMDLQGNTVKYNCTEKINVRKSDGSEASLTQADFANSFSKRQPVLIRTNSEGAINRVIQLASKDRDDLFFHEIDYNDGVPESEQSSLEYQRSKLSFSNRIMLRSNAVKMFAVPHSELAKYSLEDFSIITQAFFRSGSNKYELGTQGFRATAICMEANDFICDYMVWEYPDSMDRIYNATLNYGLVEKVFKAVDPKGDEEGYLFKIGAKEHWMHDSKDLNGNEITAGSVVVYTNSYCGRPTNKSIVVLYDLNTGTLYQQGSQGSYTKNDRFRVAKAELIDKSGSIGKFRVNRGNGVSIVQCYNMAGKTVNVYNKNSKNLRSESAVSFLQKGDEVILGIAVDSLGSIYAVK